LGLQRFTMCTWALSHGHEAFGTIRYNVVISSEKARRRNRTRKELCL
jgi:hypothetical protein